MLLCSLCVKICGTIYNVVIQQSCSMVGHIMQQLLDEIDYLPSTSQVLPTMRRMPIHCKTFVLCRKLLGESDDKLPNCWSQDTKEPQ